MDANELVFFFACNALIGGVGFWMTVLSIYNLARFIGLHLYKMEIPAVVLGYQVEEYMTKSTPRRMIRNYYPRIQYKSGTSDAINVVREVRSRRTTQFSPGETIVLLHHKKYDFYLIKSYQPRWVIWVFVLISGLVYHPASNCENLRKVL